MFSLKFDLLFPSLDMAKATARKLNAKWKRTGKSADPRELKRLQDELHLTRERVRMDVKRGRLLW
jgi:hypothetical protein